MNPEISVVVPVCNEAENVEPLAREIHAALGARPYEMIFIDDGSTDETAAILQRLKSELPALREAVAELPDQAAPAPRGRPGWPRSMATGRTIRPISRN